MAKHLEEELDAATAGFFMSDRAAPEPKLTSKEEDSEEALLETSDTSPNDVNQLSVYLEACETLDVTPNSQIIQLVRISYLACAVYDLNPLVTVFPTRTLPQENI